MSVSPRERMDGMLAAAAEAQQQQHSAQYDRALLVRLCSEHAQAVGAAEQFAALFLSYADRKTSAAVTAEAAVEAVDAFADRLVYDLFLPLQAIASCSAVVPPTPGHASAADLEQVYIFPPSPMTVADDDSNLDEPGQTAADLLEALDPEALALLRRAGGATPPADDARNQVALAPAAAAAFSRFRASLHPVTAADREPSLYRVVGAGTTTTTTPSMTVQETASAHLLALHAAMAGILHATQAGPHVDAILAETAVEDLAADGQTHLEQLLRLRLAGWWDGGRRGRGRLLRHDENEAEEDDEVWVDRSEFVG